MLALHRSGCIYSTAVPRPLALLCCNRNCNVQTSLLTWNIVLLFCCGLLWRLWCWPVMTFIGWLVNCVLVAMLRSIYPLPELSISTVAFWKTTGMEQMRPKQNKDMNCSIELDHLAKSPQTEEKGRCFSAVVTVLWGHAQTRASHWPRIFLVFFFILLVLLLSSSTLIYTLTGRHGCRQFVERCRGLIRQ